MFAGADRALKGCGGVLAAVRFRPEAGDKDRRARLCKGLRKKREKEESEKA